jgi:hypothetical protein
MAYPYTKSGQLIVDARRAGLTVTVRCDLTSVITRTGSEAAVIVVSENGTITRGDVRLDVATRMTAEQARRVLGLVA